MWDDDHENESESGSECGGDTETDIALSERAPTVERVIDALKSNYIITTSVNNSHLFADGNRELLFSTDVWRQVNSKLIAALVACAATGKKDIKSMSKKYLYECIAIDHFAAGLCSNEYFMSATFDISNPAIQRHLSLLLQMICMEYVEVFHTLIGSSSGGESLTVKEQVDSAITFASNAINIDLSYLYPRRKVLNNLYYIIGFVGGQAEKTREAHGKGER